MQKRFKSFHQVMLNMKSLDMSQFWDDKQHLTALKEFFSQKIFKLICTECEGFK